MPPKYSLSATLRQSLSADLDRFRFRQRRESMFDARPTALRVDRTISLIGLHIVAGTGAECIDAA